MTYRYNGKTLLEAACAPLAPADLERLVVLIDQRPDDGPAFIARWSVDTGVCFTATVFEGELAGWMMFPAADQDAARSMALTLHEHAMAALQGFADPAQIATAAAIAKAQRH